MPASQANFTFSTSWSPCIIVQGLFLCCFGLFRVVPGVYLPGNKLIHCVGRRFGQVVPVPEFVAAAAAVGAVFHPDKHAAPALFIRGLVEFLAGHLVRLVVVGGFTDHAWLVCAKSVFLRGGGERESEG